MTPILPREMLWTDKETMDEFFRLDPINEDFFEVFTTLREEPFGVQLDAVKVFNEVYYQMTRMVYEHTTPKDLSKYQSDIKANLGWDYSAKLVLTMGYFLFLLSNSTKDPINRFSISRASYIHHRSMYWLPFRKCYERLKTKNRSFKYEFVPCPKNAEWFADRYIRWKEITCDYNLNAIVSVIDLWKTYEEKRAIAVMIQNSIVSSRYFIGKNEKLVKPILNTLATYQIPEGSLFYASEDISPYNAKNIKELEAEIENLKKERKALLTRISELEADNERLNALLDKKKNSKGKDRKFTLAQIVDYCKERVEWDDAKSIVAMLNKLLRRIGTEEDSDLVDSIETEFRNRTLGNTYVQQQTIIPNVGNYKPQINTQKIDLPTSGIGQQGQNLLEDE